MTFEEYCSFPEAERRYIMNKIIDSVAARHKAMRRMHKDHLSTTRECDCLEIVLGHTDYSNNLPAQEKWE